MIGAQITTLRQLMEAVVDKRSVIVPKSHPWKKPRPAAFLINQSGAGLLHLFRLGMFIYEKDGPVVDAEFKPKESEEESK